MKRHDRIGELLLLRSRLVGPKSRRVWFCRCSCGKYTSVRQDALLGATRSCGHLQIAYAKTGAARMTHGLSETPIWHTWKSMLRRCYETTHKDYANYGGRGITVCASWHTFENFLADMGDPEPILTLDRKDNALGYSLGNCRWATRKEQNRHKRTTLMVKWRGRTRVFAELCERVGVNYRTAWDRLQNRDYTLQEALYGRT